MSKPPLSIPALFAQMGDWKYYNTVMRLEDVKTYIDYAETVNVVREGRQLSDLIQRALESGRSKAIGDYLVQNDDRFFNALVVAVYGGDPKWRDFDIQASSGGRSGATLPEWVENSFGLLQLSGNEKLFPLDGQHRLSGIKQALERKPELGDERISVIFVSHHVTDQGRKRTRKLFTTLNRTAINVTKAEIIALDETDTAAIITRRLVEENKKFNQGQVLAKYGTANLASTDSDSFITIIKLYDLVGYLLGHVLYNFDQLARLKLRYVRPSDEKLEEYYQAVSEFFDLFVEEIPSLKSYFTASKARSKRVLAQKRHDELNVLYRSVGLEIYIRAIQELVKKHKKSVAEAVRLVSRLPTSFSAKPYSEVLYDVAGERIIPGRVRITTSLALHMLGYSPANLDRVREKYAQILGTAADKVRLPRRVK